MLRHLQREIEGAKNKLLGQCAMVEKQVTVAARCVIEQDDGMAWRVIQDDALIDRMEVEIEEECLKILALHQPVAVDLRVLVAMLKINNVLERIGDLAVNMAERAGALAACPAALLERFDFDTMTDKVRSMLKQAVDAFVAGNDDAAQQVCVADDAVDVLCERLQQEASTLIARQPADVTVALHLLSVARDLERIADHATNIAEDVIYIITGEIIRHHFRKGVNGDKEGPGHGA